MPGVVFLVVVPTANFERELLTGNRLDQNDPLQSPVYPSAILSQTQSQPQNLGHLGSHLNINLPQNNAILRLEVELRDKNASKLKYEGKPGRDRRGIGNNFSNSTPKNKIRLKDNSDLMISMEKILEELLSKLEIEHVTWSSDKKSNYYQVVFPIQSGEPCETMLHCLTELGIGTKLNSNVSVLPCTVSYDAFTDNFNKDDYSDDDEEFSKWNNFIESIKSKLTVKQVVDGVRAGGSLSFDYLLLIVTADSLAALGLVENNSTNIVAAMLVSPLMGPVMSIAFGTIISDKELMKIGFISLSLGILISIIFGFIFGLILGTTEMPWGFTDWPTEEMRGRGNARSLWMGILWALTSGTGVAVALLQGSVGPLIGVAISASLLPPVVNCGLFWALACIWLIYPDIKMPHLKGEAFHGNTSYEFIYTNYLPTEFLINGIVSGLLTVINVICIFITAIIVLKIKEVAAPYTSSPGLRRFWETDIRAARRTNRSTIQKKDSISKKKVFPYEGFSGDKTKQMEIVLRHALKEALEDETFRKVKRISYSTNAAEELSQRLPLNVSSPEASSTHSRMNSLRNSKLNADLKTLDKLVSQLLESNNTQSTRHSKKINRSRPLSRSISSFMKSKKISSANNTENEMGNSSHIQQTSLMPTILEKNQLSQNSNEKNKKCSLNEKAISATNVKGFLNTISNVPHRFSQSHDNEEDILKLSQNF